MSCLGYGILLQQYKANWYMNPKVSKSLGVSLFHPTSAWVWSLLSPEPGCYALRPTSSSCPRVSYFLQTSTLPLASEYCKQRQFKEKMWPFQQLPKQLHTPLSAGESPLRGLSDWACSMPSSPRGFSEKKSDRRWRGNGGRWFPTAFFKAVRKVKQTAVVS